jgi:thiol:disulfide interchange protein
MNVMHRLHSVWIAILGCGLCALAAAQRPADLVQWTAAFVTTSSVRHNAVLEISGTIEEGWHVYALTQPSGGPAALHVTLDENDVAQVAGTVSGPAPRRHRDPSFGFETQFYTHSFTVRVPVVLKQPAAPGRGLVPVSVRFQTCSDRECLPPTTTHLSVPLDAARSGG